MSTAPVDVDEATRRTRLLVPVLMEVRSHLIDLEHCHDASDLGPTLGVELDPERGLAADDVAWSVSATG